MVLTMLNQLHLLHLFVMFLCFSSLALSSEPRKPEVEALINIKNGLHDPHGALNNWDEFSVDPCSWAMITHSLAPPTTSSLACEFAFRSSVLYGVH
ncbi:hypothetical protein Bca52824_089319 [Brassica carinata]|uniref:Leucine-rich repeat-containing N-terminal plant-type domain-containing protein n=1 Tax=Brassica carinata TaxID=52824 RepID=A0A8X7TQD3_BRACI|nr:hypothetical protein Bca52824_089319 [Brassica carinata]